MIEPNSSVLTIHLLFWWSQTLIGKLDDLLITAPFGSIGSLFAPILKLHCFLFITLTLVANISHSTSLSYPNTDQLSSHLQLYHSFTTRPLKTLRALIIIPVFVDLHDWFHNVVLISRWPLHFRFWGLSLFFKVAGFRWILIMILQGFWKFISFLELFIWVLSF